MSDTIELSIGGMKCGGCVNRVRAVLQATPGVAVQSVTVGSAVVTIDPSSATRESVSPALERAGYHVLSEAAHECR